MAVPIIVSISSLVQRCSHICDGSQLKLFGRVSTRDIELWQKLMSIVIGPISNSELRALSINTMF